MEEENQLSSEYSFVMMIAVIPALLFWLFLLWRTIVEQTYLFTILIVFGMIGSILQLLISHGMSVKKVYLDHLTGEFIIRGLGGSEERIAFSDLTGYKFKFQRVVKLKFTGHRNRFFRRPMGLEGKPKSYIKQRLDEIILHNTMGVLHQ